MLNFGEKIEGVEYQERPSAYAVIRNSEGKFAFVEVRGKLFLLGGGRDAGETPQETIVREAMEEAGAVVNVGRKIGEAGDYLLGKENVSLYKVGEFFQATIEGVPQHGTEADHKLVWLTFEEAKSRIRHESHAWAIEQILQK